MKKRYKTYPVFVEHPMFGLCGVPFLGEYTVCYDADNDLKKINSISGDDTESDWIVECDVTEDLAELKVYEESRLASS